MFHVDNNSAVPVMPAVKPVVSAVTSFFTEGGNGVPPTYPGPDWFNIIQSELLAVLAAAGITPDKASNVQLLAAMRALFLDTSQNGADIQDKALFLKNLGLGAGSPAVGIPFFWPHTQMPNNLVDDWNQMTFLKMNGSSFTATAYPILAKIWPGLTLPDFRGEFVRIWDDGRGVDSGRNLLTAQSFAMQNITGSFGEISDESKRYAVEINAASGAFQTQTYMRNIMRNPDFVARNAAVSITFDASRVAQTAAETRPRNISIGFIVRAK